MNREWAIHLALEHKPKMDTPCNHCGWCCLRETCQLGKLVTPDGDQCTQLVKKGDQYFCAMASTKSYAEFLHIGKGCNAISVGEKIAMLGGLLNEAV